MSGKTDELTLPAAKVETARPAAAVSVDTRVFDPSEFDIQFMPVLALQTGEIVELEAVARWRQPNRGLVPLETSGMADLATPWVFERACAVAQSLPPTRSGRRVRVSVNLTPATPLDEMLVDGVAGLLLTSGVDPSGIQLEVPIRMLDEDGAKRENTAAILKQLRDLGICLAIDGAGADIDRLPDLSTMPVSAVKVDRSVVSLIDRSADRRALVREIVERAQPFGVSVTGTGVETLEQAEKLWDLGADQGQGPLFFRSVTEEQLQSLFSNENAMAAAD
jgi:EAL domain-containing protein (putative c-di-GMP-specific phosphodiesterase class I)